MSKRCQRRYRDEYKIYLYHADYSVKKNWNRRHILARNFIFFKFVSITSKANL